MSDTEIGSLLLLQRLTANPRDQVLWTLFVSRYKDRIYAWTRRRLRDPNDADDVFMEICKKVYEILSDDARKKLRPKDDSYQAILRRICENVCRDIASGKRRHLLLDELDGPGVGAWEDRAAMELLGDLNDLDDEEVKELARYRASFRDALDRRRSEPQYKTRTTEIFFKIYRDGLATAEVNRQYGYTDRDTARKQAQRELRRLVELMNLPVGTPAEQRRSELIVAHLAKVQGDQAGCDPGSMSNDQPRK